MEQIILDNEIVEAPVEVNESASNGVRFANYLIDYVAIFVITMPVFLVLAVMGLYDLESEVLLLDQLISYVVYLIYYILIEGLTRGRSLGKLITGTKVITLEGEKPSFGVSVKRSLCRLIPFEAFSFLGQPDKGWHDSITKTRVVKIKK